MSTGGEKNRHAHYRMIDHTADIGIVVEGKSLERLFENAARAMFELITDPEQVEPRHRETLHVAGEDPTDLMINWLRELLYRWAGQELLLSDVEILRIDGKTLEAVLSLAPFRPERHHIINEIKAVTYHRMNVRRRRKTWETVIIFDV